MRLSARTRLESCRNHAVKKEGGKTPKQESAKMGLLAKLLAAVGGLVTTVMNSITDVFLTPPLQATLEHLEGTDLKTLSGGESRCWACVHIKRCSFMQLR